MKLNNKITKTIMVSIVAATLAISAAAPTYADTVTPNETIEENLDEQELVQETNKETSTDTDKEEKNSQDKKKAKKEDNKKNSNKDEIKVATTGEDVVEYALQFVGNRYRFGGTSLTNGVDCSGFVMKVYENFGVSLPHSSYGMRSKGTAVSRKDVKPGDIICYSGHVGIAIGNDAIVHASTYKTGIKISYNIDYRNIVSIRRIFD